MALTFVDILTKNEIETETTLIMRPNPEQPALARVLPWLADEHLAIHRIFVLLFCNVYRRTHHQKK